MLKTVDRIRGRIDNDRPIIVFCAPPGFGKRKLLGALWNEAQADGSSLFFDRLNHINDPRAAANSIIERPEISAIFVSDVADADKEYFSLALDRLVRTKSSQRLFIAMDEPSILDLGRLRTAGHVEWFGSDFLALTDLERRELFTKISGVMDRNRLTEIVGHWPIAAEMLIDWALRSSELARSFQDHEILYETGLFEFIKTQIWALLSEREREALGRTALLSQPSQILLRNAECHDRVITNLAIKLGGLVGQSDDVIWLSPALKLFVRENAQLEDPQAQVRTMIELVDCCSIHGNLSDAARLAAAAGQPDRIAQIAEQHGALLIWVHCGFSDLQSLVENAGTDVISRSPALRMMRCIVDLKLGQIGRAEVELQQLASDPSVADTMRTEIEIIRVTLLVYGCSLARQHDIELLADLLAQQSTEPAWQSFLATLSCILNSQRARFKTANASLIEARREAERAGSRYNIMFLFLHEAGIQIAQGAMVQARSAISAARKIWREEFASDFGVETVIAALSSKVEFETGRLTSARNSLRKSANRLPDGEAWFDIYYAAYEPMARILLREQGLSKAIEFLETEKAKLDARGLGRVGRLLKGLGACLEGEARLLGHQFAESMDNSFLVNEDVWSWQERETYNLATAYSHHMSGRSEEAIALLHSASKAAIEQSLTHSHFRYSLTLFLLCHRCNQRRDALTHLESILVLASNTGMRLVAQDVVGPIIPEYSEESIATGTLNKSQLKILTEIGTERKDIRSPNGKLSKREMDIVTALSEGDSDKEIARYLGISDHGVRYHLKNIFRKLGVHDRLAAVLSAKQKGWI